MDNVGCPYCQAKLRLPDATAGKRVKCPACGGTFTAGDEPAPRSDSPAGAAPRFGVARGAPEARGTEQSYQQREWPAGAWEGMPRSVTGWASVRTGTLLYVLGHFLYLGGLALVLLLVLVTLTASSSGPTNRGLATLLGLLAIIALLAILANWILALLGCCFWLAAPPSHGTRWLAVGCLTLHGAVLLHMPGLLTRFPLGGDEFDRHGAGAVLGPAAALLLMSFLEIARLVVFPFFLRAVALEVRSEGLRVQATVLGLGTGGLFGALVLVNLLVVLLRSPGREATAPTMNLVLIFINLLVMGGILLWGSLVLLSARTTLHAQLPD